MNPFLFMWGTDALRWGALVALCFAGLTFKPGRKPVTLLLALGLMQFTFSARETMDLLGLHGTIPDRLMMGIGLYLKIPLIVLYDASVIWLALIVWREARRDRKQDV